MAHAVVPRSSSKSRPWRSWSTRWSALRCSRAQWPVEVDWFGRRGRERYQLGRMRSERGDEDRIVEMFMLVGCQFARNGQRLGLGPSRWDPVAVLLLIMVGERVRRHPAGLGERGQEQDPTHPAI